MLALALFPSLGVQGLALAWTGAYFVAAVVALVRAAAPDRRHPVDRGVGDRAARHSSARPRSAIVAGAARRRDRHATPGQALVAAVVAGASRAGSSYVGVLAALRGRRAPRRAPARSGGARATAIADV